ncbi:MAG: DUF504 domain-containing protein [Nanoarchaeota archaeon]
MISCFEILNKIKYDKNLNKEEYFIYYLDNINKKLIEIKFNEIKGITKNFITLEDKEIPLHRIKEIRKKEKLIWKRENV